MGTRGNYIKHTPTRRSETEILYSCIKQLYEDNFITFDKLAHHVNTNHVSLTKYLDELVKRNFIIRAPVPAELEDKIRAKKGVLITHKGREFYEKMRDLLSLLNMA